MDDEREAGAKPEPDLPYALGWASVGIAGLAYLYLPARGQMAGRYEDEAIVSAVFGAVAAVGVGFGLRALRKRIRPLGAAWAGLLGNFGVIGIVVVRLTSWL